MALGYPEVTEHPHFEKTSFRVNKKIFATMDEKNKKATLKLSEVDQSVFCSFDKKIFNPANGAWGKQGWTTVEMGTVPATVLKDALAKAYLHVSS